MYSVYFIGCELVTDVLHVDEQVRNSLTLTHRCVVQIMDLSAIAWSPEHYTAVEICQHSLPVIVRQQHQVSDLHKLYSNSINVTHLLTYLLTVRTSTSVWKANADRDIVTTVPSSVCVTVCLSVTLQYSEPPVT